jgi:hypothetical protein
MKQNLRMKITLLTQFHQASYPESSNSGETIVWCSLQIHGHCMWWNGPRHVNLETANILNWVTPEIKAWMGKANWKKRWSFVSNLKIHKRILCIIYLYIILYAFTCILYVIKCSERTYTTLNIIFNLERGRRLVSALFMSLNLL